MKIKEKQKKKLLAVFKPAYVDFCLNLNILTVDGFCVNPVIFMIHAARLKNSVTSFSGNGVTNFVSSFIW